MKNMKKMLACVMAALWLAMPSLARAQDEEPGPGSGPAAPAAAQDQNKEPGSAAAVTPLPQDQNEEPGSGPAVAPSAQDQYGKPDFRQVRWGMTPEEVEKAETRAKRLFAAGDERSPFSSLSYEARIAGKAFSLEYLFLNGKLNGAVLAGLGNYVNKNNYVADYETLKKMLTERYGAPAEDETTWSQTFYKDVPEYLGIAYSVGDVRSKTLWRTEKTAVQLEIFGELYRLQVVLTYSSAENLDESMKASKEDSLIDL